LEGSLAGELTERQHTALAKWVGDGGTVIASAVEGLDDLSGNRSVGRLPQPEGEFSCAATFALRPHPLTREIHSPLQPNQRLLAFSGIRLIQPDSSVELARLFDPSGRDTGFAAVTERRIGKGRVFS